jgi:hypothetical protein
VGAPWTPSLLLLPVLFLFRLCRGHAWQEDLPPRILLRDLSDSGELRSFLSSSRVCVERKFGRLFVWGELGA